MSRITRTGEIIMTCPVHTITSIGATPVRKNRSGFRKTEWSLDLLNIFTTIVALRRDRKTVTRDALATHLSITPAVADIWLRRLLAKGAIHTGRGGLRLEAGRAYFVAPQFVAFGEEMQGK